MKTQPFACKTRQALEVGNCMCGPIESAERQQRGLSRFTLHDLRDLACPRQRSTMPSVARWRHIGAWFGF